MQKYYAPNKDWKDTELLTELGEVLCVSCSVPSILEQFKIFQLNISITFGHSGNYADELATLQSNFPTKFDFIDLCLLPEKSSYAYYSHHIVRM